MLHRKNLQRCTSLLFGRKLWHWKLATIFFQIIFWTKLLKTKTCVMINKRMNLINYTCTEKNEYIFKWWHKYPHQDKKVLNQIALEFPVTHESVEPTFSELSVPRPLPFPSLALRHLAYAKTSYLGRGWTKERRGVKCRWLLRGKRQDTLAVPFVYFMNKYGVIFYISNGNVLRSIREFLYLI